MMGYGEHKTVLRDPDTTTTSRDNADIGHKDAIIGQL